MRETGVTHVRTLFAIVLSVILLPQALASETTYDVLVAGKSCQEGKQQNLSCSYRAGKSLLVEIAGIGSPDTGVAFLKSDYKGDYYAKYGLLHGCIIVNRTSDLNSFAFISPMNGKIYKTWQECKAGM